MFCSHYNFLFKNYRNHLSVPLIKAIVTARNNEMPQRRRDNCSIVSNVERSSASARRANEPTNISRVLFSSMFPLSDSRGGED